MSANLESDSDTSCAHIEVNYVSNNTNMIQLDSGANRHIFGSKHLVKNIKKMDNPISVKGWNNSYIRTIELEAEIPNIGKVLFVNGSKNLLSQSMLEENGFSVDQI